MKRLNRLVYTDVRRAATHAVYVDGLWRVQPDKQSAVAAVMWSMFVCIDLQIGSIRRLASMLQTGIVTAHMLRIAYQRRGTLI